MREERMIQFRKGDQKALASEFLEKTSLDNFDCVKLANPEKLVADDILAVHYSDVGAQGDAGVVEILYLSKEGLQILKGNYAYGDLDIDAVYQKLPMLEYLDCRKGMPYPFGGKLIIPTGWGYLYMGLSNHFFARRIIWKNAAEFIRSVYRDLVFEATAWYCGMDFKIQTSQENTKIDEESSDYEYKYDGNLNSTFKLYDLIRHAKETEEEALIYAEQMKANNPHMLDYGYGMAGHTLNDWKEMRKFFIHYGLKTIAEGSNVSISKAYRTRVGAIVDNFIAASKVNSSYLGHCCWFGTVDQFVNTTKEMWMSSMIERYSTVSPWELDSRKKKTWSDYYSTLKRALRKNTNLKEALLVFEYTLPVSNWNREVRLVFWSNSLIVTEGKIVALEFDNTSIDEKSQIDSALSKAYNCGQRLVKWHVASLEKQLECVAVSTKMKGIYSRKKNGTCCSGDYLYKVLSEAIPTEAKPFDYEAWLNSPFIGITD